MKGDRAYLRGGAAGYVAAETVVPPDGTMTMTWEGLEFVVMVSHLLAVLLKIGLE